MLLDRSVGLPLLPRLGAFALAGGDLTLDLGFIAPGPSGFAIESSLLPVDLGLRTLQRLPGTPERLMAPPQHAACPRSLLVVELLALVEKPLALVGPPLAFVGPPLAFVGASLAFVGESLALVGDLIPLVRPKGSLFKPLTQLLKAVAVHTHSHPILAPRDSHFDERSIPPPGMPRPAG